jgi:hypothetical protein
MIGSVANDSRRPGGFAAQRYRDRRRNWLKRVWWALPVLFLPVPVVVVLGLILQGRVSGFLWGLAIGVSAGAVLVILDSPPSYIARWRAGAEGERATAKALRPLLREGWIVLHDIPTDHGNIDHLLIGPPGVFLLESKNLSGVVSVEQGRLRVRWHEDPNDGYDNDSIARRARAAAATVHGALQTESVSTWVQPVVVLWADFPQITIQSTDVAWIRGRDLDRVLRARPIKFTQNQIDQASAAARRTLTPEHT